MGAVLKTGESTRIARSMKYFKITFWIEMSSVFLLLCTKVLVKIKIWDKKMIKWQNKTNERQETAATHKTVMVKASKGVRVYLN